MSEYYFGSWMKEQAEKWDQHPELSFRNAIVICARHLGLLKCENQAVKAVIRREMVSRAAKYVDSKEKLVKEISLKFGIDDFELSGDVLKGIQFDWQDTPRVKKVDCLVKLHLEQQEPLLRGETIGKRAKNDNQTFKDGFNAVLRGANFGDKSSNFLETYMQQNMWYI